MTDPFRDGMQAALARSETLEDENELLREEVDRLRNDVEELRGHAQKLGGTSASKELVSDARDVLDRLEAASRRGDKLRVALDRSFTGTERALDAVSPSPRPASDSRSLSLDEKPETYAPVIRPSPPPAPPTPRGWIVLLGFVSFGLGFLTAVLAR
jgi:hypothetical protein